MKIRSLGYNIKQGFKNIARNKMFSLASIATMAACLFLFGVFYSIVTNFEYMVKKAENSVCVTVLFDEGISDQRKAQIGQDIEQRVEVSSIHYTSADEAWESFSKDYFGDYLYLAEGFKDDNPLATSDSYSVYLNDASMQGTLVTYLENMDGVRQVNRSEVMASSLSNVAILVGYASAAIIIVLLGVSIFLISNTVIIGVTVRKDEISIMKLIGATDAFVNAPFVVEGVVIGLVGSVIPLLIIYYMYDHIVNYVLTRFSILSNILVFLPAHTIFRVLVPVTLLVGVGIGFAGSVLALRKHTNV